MNRPDADVLYTSDLHGHEPLYHETLDAARHARVRAVILGGDLAPHGEVDRQRRFFRDFLVPLLREYASEPGSADVYYIFGNDDWRAAGAVLEAAEHPRLIHAHGRVLPFLDGTHLAGLACVPITPFGMKDWDRWEARLSPAARMRGFRSTPEGALAEFDFAGREEEESLARDFGAIEAAVPAGARLICAFHGPPHGTDCDQIGGGIHVGSHETRGFLERVRPLIALHGHIHESPDVSGRFADRVGPTICVNPGQRMGSALHAVTFRIADVAGTLTHTLMGPARLPSA